MPEWYKAALSNRQDPSASILFAKEFLAGSPSDRTHVVTHWDPNLLWVLPNPWRLACTDEGPGSPMERIQTDLVFQALRISALEVREATMGLAVAYNSCGLAGIDPKPVFEEIAQAVGGGAGQALRAFVNRDAKDQSMEAFLLTAVDCSGGGYEIVPNW